MKRFLILTLTFLSVLMLAVLPAGAAESFDLIPHDAYWTNTDQGGASVTVEHVDGVFVFSGSFAGTWPCTETRYDTTAIAASVDNYSLVYDFVVEGGETNINFFFDDGNGGKVDYTICNTALGSVSYDAGSGDLKSGTYQGAITLTDFINSCKLFDSQAFPTSAIIDGELRFIGIQIYSVNGAKITISKLAIVHNDDVANELPSDEPDEPSDEPVSSEEPEVSPEESKADSEETVETEDSSSAEPAVSEDKNSNDGAESKGNEEKDSTSVLVTIIVAVAVLICIIIVIILLRRKQKRQ